MNMEKQNEQLRCIIYARKSSESEDRQVQSLDDQKKIMQEICEREDAKVIDIIEEAKSARFPEKRARFKEMIKRLNKGEIDCVACWKLDRLARNPIDGGMISWLLQRGVIKKIITSDRVYHPHDNIMMMSFEFVMANQYVNDLSTGVKRGQKSKLEKGVWPGIAPIGYRNNIKKHTIVMDPARAPIIRKIFEHMLTGAYTPPQILDKVNNDWGFRSLRRKRTGGRKMSMSTIYKTLHNPFYMGCIRYGDRIYPGTHKPIVTKTEFERVQQILGGNTEILKHKKEFYFNGLIKCEVCGHRVTAEHKINRFGSEYVYYHCSHRHRRGNCVQPSVEEKTLVDQVDNLLRQVHLPESYLKWALEELERQGELKENDTETIAKSIAECIGENKKKLERLMDMKLNGMINDDEYWEKKNNIIQENKELQSKLVRKTKDNDKWVELTRDTFKFVTYARAWLKNGGREERKKILLGLCSNPSLKDKELLVLQERHIEIVKVKMNLLRGLNGVFEPFKITYTKRKTTPENVVYSTMQDLVEAVATYFQGIEPGSVYVPKCDKHKFE